MSKLNGNGIFESSRFVIPQHREALLTYHHEQERRIRPRIDDQEWDVIGGKLQQSMNERESITLELFEPFECKQVTGVVVDIDVSRRRVKLQQDDECSWIRIENIIEVF